ncbi:MAG: hypothetical protein ACI8T1_000769 [Verrucomicrobiales bacterium]|jgi:hypothetical protein
MTMNKAALIHGTWLVIASASFWSGYQVFPAGAGNEKKSGATSSTTAGASLIPSSKAKGEADAKESPGQGGNKTRPLSERDIAMLGKQLLKDSSPIKRRLAFSQLLEGLTAENALLIREQIAGMDHRSAEFREFHYAWGAIGGVDAAMFGAGTPEDDMSPALAGWASASPTEALAWFRNLDMENDPGFDPLLKDRKLNADGLRRHLMQGLVQGLANTDPHLASEFIGEVATGPHDRGANRMMHGVVEAVMRTEKPSQAAKWAETLPEGNARSIAMSRVAERYSRHDVQGAAAWAETHANQPENGGVIGAVGHQWATKDPNAAVEWVSNLPDSQGKHVGMHRTLHEWADNDPAAASEYLATMPDSGVKNAAIGGFSRRLAQEDPQAAITWAGTISSEEQRHQTMISVGQAWLRKDGNAAREWAVSAGLPENVQQAILNPKRDQ